MNALTDFYYQKEGSIVMLIPNTQDAHEWAEDNLSPEPWQMMGNNIVVDYRLFPSIEEGIENDGYIIEEV